MLSDDQIDEIAARHRERKVHHNRIPTGPYLDDSVGFVHNALAERPADTPGGVHAHPTARRRGRFTA